VTTSEDEQDYRAGCSIAADKPERPPDCGFAIDILNQQLFEPFTLSSGGLRSTVYGGEEKERAQDLAVTRVYGTWSRADRGGKQSFETSSRAELP